MKNAAILALSLGLSGLPLHAQQASEEGAVRKVLSDLMEAFNKHDGAAVAKDYAPDFDHVNVMGRWTHGKEPMEKMYIREHAPGGLLTGGGTRTANVQQIKFVRPDVALAITESKDEKNHLRSTYLLTKEGPKWLIRSITVSPITNLAQSTK